MRTLLRYPTLILFMLIFAPGSHATQRPESGGAAHLSIAPDTIRIHAFYRGTDIAVSADLPFDCDGAVVKIQSDEEEITLKRKGRVYIFWLNVDDVTLSNAPGIYIVSSSAPLGDISKGETRQTLLLGYDALKEHVNINARNDLVGSEFTDFIKLKEHNGSYQLNTEGQLLPAADGKGKSFKAFLHIPPVMPSGDYRILLYYFKNRALAGESGASFIVEKVGLPNYLHSLAFEHPAIYGLFACIIAMATGIIMSLIFGSRRKR
jgi:uncharacterized protein (TIGR02186 family)